MVKKKCSLIENQELVRLIRNKALEEVEKMLEEKIEDMNEMFLLIKDKERRSEHDRGWNNCSIYIKDLKQQLKNMRDEK